MIGSSSVASVSVGYQSPLVVGANQRLKGCEGTVCHNYRVDRVEELCPWGCLVGVPERQQELKGL